MKSLEDLIEEVQDDGWLVSDFYQTSPTRWNAVLRIDGHMSTAYGTGGSAKEALTIAMGNRRAPTNWKRVREDQERAKAAPRERISTRRERL